MAGWNNRDEPQALKEFLDEKSAYYDSAFFIETDPIQVPHQFSEPEDIEIAYPRKFARRVFLSYNNGKGESV